MKLSVITLTYNNLKYTKKFIKSLYANTKDFELIIVDNGSTDGTVEYLKNLSYGNLKLILNSKNLGYSKGNNQGIKIAEGEYLAFINNDVILPDNWFSNVEYVFKENPTAGIVSPIHINPHFYKTNEYKYQEFFSKIEFKKKYLRTFDGVCFACAVVKRCVIDKIGGFDENYTPAFFEDDDLKYRAIDNGFDCYVTNQSCFYHFGSKTSDNFTEYFNKNRHYYYRKCRFGEYLKMSTFEAENMAELENFKNSFLYKAFYILPSNIKATLKRKTKNFIKNKIIGQKIEYEWKNDFCRYFDENEMSNKIKNLKSDMDKISQEYVDYFMELSKYWSGKKKRGIWSKYDLKIFKQYKKFFKYYEQPYSDITTFNPFIFYNQYGLKDLPESVYNQIDGKTIIDVGGYNGDTAILFNQIFPKSKIMVYEPLSVHLNKLRKILALKDFDNKIVPIQKGLGDKDEITEISFIETETCEITTLDKELTGKSEDIGLIKMDVEGFETAVVSGAVETIKRYKPVLAIAIYHTPEDFFEMKDKIKTINPNYKFMIRRSEAVVPQADLVLIAY